MYCRHWLVQIDVDSQGGAAVVGSLILMLDLEAQQEPEDLQYSKGINLLLLV